MGILQDVQARIDPQLAGSAQFSPQSVSQALGPAPQIYPSAAPPAGPVTVNPPIAPGMSAAAAPAPTTGPAASAPAPGMASAPGSTAEALAALQPQSDPASGEPGRVAYPQVVIPPKEPIHKNILAEIGSVLHNYITQNPNTIAGNVMSAGIAGAAGAAARYPLLLQQRRYEMAKQAQDLATAQATAHQNWAMGEKSLADAREAAVKAKIDQDKLDILAPGQSYSGPNNENIVQKMPDGSFKTVYASPTQQIDMLAKAEDYTGKMIDAKDIMENSKASLFDRIKAKHDYQFYKAMSDGALASFKSFVATAQGQQNLTPNIEIKEAVATARAGMRAAASARKPPPGYAGGGSYTPDGER